MTGALSADRAGPNGRIFYFDRGFGHSFDFCQRSAAARHAVRAFAASGGAFRIPRGGPLRLGQREYGGRDHASAVQPGLLHGPRRYLGL